MFLACFAWRFLYFCFPRVSGDVSLTIKAIAGIAPFSPRERGCFQILVFKVLPV